MEKKVETRKQEIGPIQVTKMMKVELERRKKGMQQSQIRTKSIESMQMLATA